MADGLMYVSSSSVLTGLFESGLIAECRPRRRLRLRVGHASGVCESKSQRRLTGIAKRVLLDRRWRRRGRR